MIKSENNTIVIKPLKREVVEETFGILGKSKKPGWKIVKKMREEEEKRLKGLGL